MSVVDDAQAAFLQGYSCSQSVLAAFAPGFGLDREVALRLSAAFGGGMARAGETCGAVTGSLMVIGLRYGHVTVDDPSAKERTTAAAQAFMTRFREEHGTLKCRELLGYDLDTAEGREAAKGHRLSEALCTRLVRDAAAAVAEIIRDGAAHTEAESSPDAVLPG